MAEWAGIEQLHLSRERPKGSFPVVPAALQRLVETHGPIEPVVVRPRGARFEILSNAETWLAAQRAGWLQVPIAVRDDVTDDEARAIVALTSGAGRSDPIEEARRYEAELDRLCAGDRRRRHGAVTRLARALGKSRTHVSHTLRLLTLPARIQRLVARGELSAGHARALVTVKDARRQARLAERIVLQRLSVREAEAAAQGRRARSTGTLPLRPDEVTLNVDPDVRRLEKTLSDTLGSAARIDTGRGRLTIHYGRNLDVLQGVLERLGIGED